MTTPRLVLRTYRRADLPSLAAMNADPRVMEFLGGPRPVENSTGFAAWANDGFAARGYGMMAVERRADDAFLGIAGLNRLDWYPEDIEVGWRLQPEAWGQGYATEAGRAWIGFAFRRHGVGRVISVADGPNRRSIAVMERMGMRLDHRATLRDSKNEFETAVYAVTPEEWEQRSGET